MKRRLPLILLLVLASAAALATPDPVGRWSGALELGTVSLRLRFNVTGTPDDLQVTLDSLDQGAMGIPARIEVAGTSVTFLIASIGGRFTGEFSGDGTTIDGQWTQAGSSRPLVLTRGDGESAADLPSASVGDQPHGADVPGIWLGTLSVGLAELRLQFRVTETAGELRVELDSLDQGAHGVPANVVLEPERVVRFRVPGIGGQFVGALDAAADTLGGEWFQSAQTFPLVLTRAETEAVLHRPQEPTPPYPYEAQDVAFPGGAGDVTLAGTLTVPAGDGPFPAAVLVSGSEPQDRNEELLGHKPFLIIADHLTRAGIAVLRYDDRGTAASTGDFDAATTADFAADAAAAVEFLRGRAEIDAKAVGVVGHSEGGLVAPLVATADDDLGYIVMLAGPGVKGREIILHQTDVMLRASGMDEATVAEETESLAAAIAVLDEIADREQARAEIVSRLVARAAEAGDEPDSAAVATLAERITGPWFRWFMNHDPVPVLGAVTCPVFAVWGSLDLQVDPAQNRPPVEAALRAGNSPHWEARVFDGLNHLFQPATTGAMSEYSRIETTFAPEALAAVAEWILAVTRGK